MSEALQLVRKIMKPLTLLLLAQLSCLLCGCEKERPATHEGRAQETGTVATVVTKNPEKFSIANVMPPGWKLQTDGKEWRWVDAAGGSWLPLPSRKRAIENAWEHYNYKEPQWRDE